MSSGDWHVIVPSSQVPRGDQGHAAAGAAAAPPLSRFKLGVTGGDDHRDRHPMEGVSTVLGTRRVHTLATTPCPRVHALPGMTGAEVAVEDDTASGGGSLSSTPARKLSARLAKFAYSPARRTGLKAEEGSPSVKPSPFVSPSPSPRKKQRDSNHPAGATPESTASSPGPSRAAHGQGDAESDGSELHELTPTRRKLKKVPRGYAAPETYDHLLGIPDYLAPGLSGGLHALHINASTADHTRHA